MFRRPGFPNEIDVFFHPWPSVRIPDCYSVTFTIHNENSQQFIFSMHEDNSAGPFCISRPIISSWGTFCTAFPKHFPAVRSACYGTQWTGSISLDVSSIRHFAVLMWPRCSSHIFSNLDSSWMNSYLLVLYLSATVILLCQYLESFFLLFQLLVNGHLLKPAKKRLSTNKVHTFV